MFFLVDAFSTTPFKGNPAGVCFIDDYPGLSACHFQKLANYFNWSEIAFVRYIAPETYRIRWFSPLDEAPLCGHATLGAAHALFSCNKIVSNKICFIYNDKIRN